MRMNVRITCCSNLRVASFSSEGIYSDNWISGTEEAEDSLPPSFDIFMSKGCTFNARSKGENSCSKIWYKSLTSCVTHDITLFDTWKHHTHSHSLLYRSKNMYIFLFYGIFSFHLTNFERSDEREIWGK